MSRIAFPIPIQIQTDINAKKSDSVQHRVLVVYVFPLLLNLLFPLVLLLHGTIENIACSAVHSGRSGTRDADHYVRVISGSGSSVRDGVTRRGVDDGVELRVLVHRLEGGSSRVLVMRFPHLRLVVVYLLLVLTSAWQLHFPSDQ